MGVVNHTLSTLGTKLIETVRFVKERLIVREDSRPRDIISLHSEFDLTLVHIPVIRVFFSLFLHLETRESDLPACSFFLDCPERIEIKF